MNQPVSLSVQGVFRGSLVSSDSDFTRLAARLREEGLTVYGFGERKTPGPFVSACDKFIYTEVLRADNTESKTQDNVTGDTPTAPPTPKPVSNDPPPLNLIASVIEDICGEEDWANLGTVGQHLNKRKPDFDTRLYGHQKLSDMMRAYPKWFQIKKEAGKGILVKALRK
ncbi:OST-HTH/LOTUS domain-containing protein [Alcanivorax hongdengensis]|uniref:NYN domain-containing protein n=1 Tax=Alcanivorax hongdengensis TaxID=519051 RepID=UPI0002E4665F|nr:OST-HTH/LOTUS domain-containing protein [Alcanivorax hongdengensis]